MLCVYLVTNLVNEKHYVGWTIDLVQRWRCHRWSGSGCVALRRAIAKHGVENFVVDPIEWCETDSEVKIAERFWISWYESFGPLGYNLTGGGDGSLGVRHSDETREKMSIAHRQESDETRARKSASALRRAPHSAETIKKGADARRGHRYQRSLSVEALVEALILFCGDATKTAESLGISTRTIRRIVAENPLIEFPSATSRRRIRPVPDQRQSTPINRAISARTVPVTDLSESISGESELVERP